MSYSSAFLNIQMTADRENRSYSFSLDLKLRELLKGLLYLFFIGPNSKVNTAKESSKAINRVIY